MGDDDSSTCSSNPGLNGVQAQGQPPGQPRLIPEGREKSWRRVLGVIEKVDGGWTSSTILIFIPPTAQQEKAFRAVSGTSYCNARGWLLKGQLL